MVQGQPMESTEPIMDTGVIIEDKPKAPSPQKSDSSVKRESLSDVNESAPAITTTVPSITSSDNLSIRYVH